MSSLAEIDISQSSDAASYLSFPEANNSLQQSCQSLCDQEGSWDFQSNCSSYHSTSEILLQEEATHVQSENTLLQQQFLQRHNMFYEECNKHVTNSVSGGFKENISPPVYDEQEGEKEGDV